MRSGSSPYKRPVVATVSALLLVLQTPGVSQAVEQGKLEKTRKRIAEIRSRLADAKGRQSVIKAQVTALDKQIASLNRQIETGQHDLSRLESGVRTVSAEIQKLEARYYAATQASNERARRLYKAGPGQALSRIFSANSLVEFMRLQFWFQVASEIDGRTMINTARVKSELAERRDDLHKIKSDVSERRAWVEKQLDLAQGARADRDVALQSVNKEVEHHEEDIEALELESRRLTQALKASSSVSRAVGGVVGAASRSGFVWPVRGGVTSGFGPRGGRMHSGLDIDGNTGEPIRAAKAGQVAGVGCGGGYGICTVIDHGGGVTTLYAHQSRKAISGGQVSTGQVIGYVGCTGSCTGSHLHFEVRVNGSPRNPRGFLP